MTTLTRAHLAGVRFTDLAQWTKTSMLSPFDQNARSMEKPNWMD